ncbi:MAG: tetratricopeptide repeat protein [Balneolaceae bacterium]
MSLTQRQQSFIRKKYPGWDSNKLAQKLGVEEAQVAAFIEREGLAIAPERRRLLMAIAIALPFLFFGMLEAGLRLADYKGDVSLFSEMTVYETEYLRPNRNFTARYFFYTRTLPTPNPDLFLKEKPDNGFRVFMMGGSTAAGYPYGHNALPSRLVKDALDDVMPDRHVEVVNVATSAINTYTLYDQVREILQHRPDLILIYSGHNEYYGALGVGSNEQLGGFPGFVRLYLNMQRVKTFLLLRDAMSSVSQWLTGLRGGDPADPGGTLMERIVREQSIPIDSHLYEMGKRQFRSNLEAIVEGFSAEGVPVMIGSLASNLKDHAPFISDDTDPGRSATIRYRDGLQHFMDGQYHEALPLLQQARDMDLLKFRAPSDMNQIIRDVTEQTDALYVPIKEKLQEFSPGGIIGEELMLEHLHPNDWGYFLMGIGFIEALNHHRFFEQATNPDGLKTAEAYRSSQYLTEFDARVGYHRIRLLKEGWPFTTSGSAPSYRHTYTPENVADSLAFEMVHNRLDWDRAKVELAGAYRRSDQPDMALQQYYGLIRSQPWNDSPYLFAARVFLDDNDFDRAYPLLMAAYEINPNEAFTNKMLGAIEVDRRNLQRGIALLSRSLELAPDDPQALYNLSGAYGLSGEYQQAMELSDRLMEVDPNYPGARSWRQQLRQIVN